MTDDQEKTKAQMYGWSPARTSLSPYEWLCIHGATGVDIEDVPYDDDALEDIDLAA